ncbi:MAG TPA: hypothetical protein VMA53_28495 [Stellaceae bacterium]|nr:hypothetical protein [Stellaceae bacterium]
MIARTALFASLFLSLSAQAHALCRDDLQDLKPRIDQTKVGNLQRYWLAEKWYGRALEAEPGSESECLNYVARAEKALRDPLPAAADCTGTNANLAQCQNNGVGGAYGGPTQPFAFGAGGLGGGGGGGGAPAAAAAAQPTAPVTSGGSAPFTPPGSVGTPSISSGD